jgi:GT2 family glycosyltransferase
MIVDDGSTDGTSDYIRKNYPDVKITNGNGGLWWTASLNLGLSQILTKAGKDDFVWIVNNDCYFDQDLLQNLINFQRKLKSNKCIIGTIVLDSKTNDVWDSGVMVDWAKLKFSRSTSTKKIDALSTKGTLYPVDIFRKVGYFDEKHFPHYFSDYEFSIRAKRMGYDLLISPDCKIYNEVARTGIEKVERGLGIAGTFQTLFSRKSKVNIADNFNIIRFVCPPEYRLRNYFMLFLKVVYLGTFFLRRKK